MFLPNVLFRCFRFQAYSELLPLSGSFLLPCGSHITKMLKQPHVFYILVEFLFCRPDIAELELKLSEYTKKMSNLQQMVQELASKVQQDMQWYKSFQFSTICPMNIGFCWAESEINSSTLIVQFAWYFWNFKSYRDCVLVIKGRTHQPWHTMMCLGRQTVSCSCSLRPILHITDFSDNSTFYVAKHTRI